MSSLHLVTTMCVAEVLGMISMFTLAALLPDFIKEWQLTNTQAGWLSAISLGSYTLSVPLLVSLTDRVDPKRLYLVSTGLGAVSALGFALLAQGFWTALIFRILTGIALAGTYMPGLKAMSDHVEENQQPRAIAFYTASFGIGTALSFFLAGHINSWLNWHWAFAAGAAGSVLAFILVAKVLPARTPQRLIPSTALLDFRPVLRNRSSVAYILCYAAHNWELFGVRSWIVALLAFTQERHLEVGPLSPTLIATIMTLLGVWASIAGNELAMRVGRRRLIATVMLISAILCCLTGFVSTLSYTLLCYFCLFHGIVVTGESASITAGVLGTATPGYRGATMALHSTFGFGFAFLGPLFFGWVLDLSGSNTPMAWSLAFTSLGIVMLLGPMVLILLHPEALPADRKK